MCSLKSFSLHFRHPEKRKKCLNCSISFFQNETKTLINWEKSLQDLAACTATFCITTLKLILSSAFLRSHCNVSYNHIQVWTLTRPLQNLYLFKQPSGKLPLSHLPFKLHVGHHTAALQSYIYLVKDIVVTVDIWIFYTAAFCTKLWSCVCQT